MSAKYTVVQYTPDPATDERINFGLISWNESGIYSRFLQNSKRIKSFAQEDVGFLDEFADEFTEFTKQQYVLPLTKSGEIDLERFQKMIGEWRHSIQFTEPRGALAEPKDLIDELASLFLHDSTPRKRRRSRDRRFARKKVYDLVTNVIAARPDLSPLQVHQREEVSGRIASHRFDVVVRNGSPLGAMHTLSFEIENEDYLGLEVDSTAWSISDVRDAEVSNLALGVYVLPPKSKSHIKKFDSAIHIFESLDAVVIDSEHGVEEWARHVR